MYTVCFVDVLGVASDRGTLTLRMMRRRGPSWYLWPRRDALTLFMLIAMCVNVWLCLYVFVCCFVVMWRACVSH